MPDDPNDISGSPDPTHALVAQIARALVDHPEQVEVRAVAREESTVLRLHVCESDVGKVIGKQGRTAHSLRTILSAVSMKYHHRYTLDIVEIGEANKDSHTQTAREAFHTPTDNADGAQAHKAIATGAGEAQE